MKPTAKHIIIGLVLFLLSAGSVFAQQKERLTQIDVGWKYKPTPENRWSFAVGSAYRSTSYSSGSFDYSTNFLQLNAAPKFSISSNHAVSIEVRYRIKELFNSQLTDEKRIIQQYNHSYKSNNISFKGRLRVEQRFRDSFNLRNRYRLGISFPINKNPDPLKEWFFTANTEALWSITPHKRSAFDQRFTIVLEKPISKTVVLKLQPQYRYLDYIHDAHDIFRIYGTLSISL